MADVYLYKIVYVFQLSINNNNDNDHKNLKGSDAINAVDAGDTIEDVVDDEHILNFPLFEDENNVKSFFPFTSIRIFKFLLYTFIYRSLRAMIVHSSIQIQTKQLLFSQLNVFRSFWTIFLLR